MKKRTLYIVVKNELLTRFMRDADMFEPFKFVGQIMEATQGDHTDLTAKQLLERVVKHDSKEYNTVGVIIPGHDAAFLPNHNVYSDGTNWMTVSDLCEQYNSKLED